MVHPTELLRNNSNTEFEFSAPTSVINSEKLDCGLTHLPILNKCCNLESYAKPKIFLLFLSLVGFMQSVTITYFRDTSLIWHQHYNINEENADWLMYTNEFFVGIIALLVSYYGNKIHRTSWVGGLAIYQAIASGLLIVPELHKKLKTNKDNFTDLICHKEKPTTVPEIEVNYIALSVIAVFLIFFAMASVAFISHGMSYLDDNISTKYSPVYIGIALACRELGKQAGLYFAWIPIFSKFKAVFISPMWLAIGGFTFASGVVLAMFPRDMPAKLMRNISASIVDLASGNIIMPKRTQYDGFFRTTRRLLTNRILLLNILAMALLQAAIINFNIFEKQFNQSSFQISDFTDSTYTQFTTNVLRQPLVMLTIVATGAILAKANLRLKTLVIWNIVVTVLTLFFFASTSFLKCEPVTKYGHMLAVTDCAKNCNCNFTVFSPVCVHSRTYYSPCFAGCQTVEEEDSIKYFSNCMCGDSYSKYREGPCDSANCNLFYALSQVNRVLTAAFLSSTIVTNILINMRCSLKRDKAVALGLDATFTSLITYLPVKAIYGVIAKKFCISPSNNPCTLYSRDFSRFLSGSTMGLIFISLLFYVILVFVLKYSTTTDSEPEEESSDIELESQVGQDQTDNRSNKKQRDSGETGIDSLLELEDIGDDHDSVASEQILDGPRTPFNRRRLLESSL